MKILRWEPLHIALAKFGQLVAHMKTYLHMLGHILIVGEVCTLVLDEIAPCEKNIGNDKQRLAMSVAV